tara:strand:+ start:770 stop:889 length:120 start_codon:yes stop_codon:yes gene_type:complete
MNRLKAVRSIALDENIGIHINDHTISFFDLGINEVEKYH